MKILGLIPARGGSKGVKRKNIKLLGGKPLIGYSIACGLKSKILSDVVVSTEDKEIAEIARSLGADVPFLRPHDLASDESPTIDSVVQALEVLKDRNYDAVCLLQPTCPFRSVEDLDAALKLFISEDADSLMSMKKVPHEYHPNWVYTVNSDGTIVLYSGDKRPVIRRQELSDVLVRDGSIYITKSSIVLGKHTLYGEKIVPFLGNKVNHVNIDTEEDWELAERIISNEGK